MAIRDAERGAFSAARKNPLTRVLEQPAANCSRRSAPSSQVVTWRRIGSQYILVPSRFKVLVHAFRIPHVIECQQRAIGDRNEFELRDRELAWSPASNAPTSHDEFRWDELVIGSLELPSEEDKRATDRSNDDGRRARYQGVLIGVEECLVYPLE